MALLQWTERYSVGHPAVDHEHRELIDLIFRLPYCRIGDLVDAGIAKRQTASVYLKQLVEIGVLSEAETTKEKLFIHHKLLTLLRTESNQLEPY